MRTTAITATESSTAPRRRKQRSAKLSTIHRLPAHFSKPVRLLARPATTACTRLTTTASITTTRWATAGDRRWPSAAILTAAPASAADPISTGAPFDPSRRFRLNTPTRSHNHLAPSEAPVLVGTSPIWRTTTTAQPEASRKSISKIGKKWKTWKYFFIEKNNTKIKKSAAGQTWSAARTPVALDMENLTGLCVFIYVTFASVQKKNKLLLFRALLFVVFSSLFFWIERKMTRYFVCT